MTPTVIFFKTVKKTNVVFLKNPSKRKLTHKSGANKGKVRKIEHIMYNRDYDTILVEDLKKINPNITPTSLSTRKGIFRIQEDDIYLLEFLRASEQNVANGGDLFMEVNVEKDESFQIEGFEAYDKAINGVMKSTDNEARALGMEFISPAAIHYSVQKIKLQLRQKLSNSDKLVESVNHFIEEKVSDERLLITVAITEGIIEFVEGRKVVWTNGELFFTASQSQDVVNELALWLKNDEEGRQYLKAITDKVENIKK